MLTSMFQDLLEDEDDDDGPIPASSLNDRIASLKRNSANGADHTRVNGNNNTATTQNGSNATPLHRMDRDSAKEKSRDLTEAWTKNIEEKMARIDRDRERDEELERKKQEDTADSAHSSERSTRESTPKRDTPEQRELSESAKVFERIRGKKPGQDDTETSTEEKPKEQVTMRQKSKPEEEEKQKSKQDDEEDKRKSVKDLIANQENALSAPASPQHAASEPKEETREERLNRLQEKIASLKKRFPKEDEQQKEPERPNRPKPQSPVAERKSSSPIPERRSPKPQSPLVSRSSSRSDSPGIVQDRVSSPKRASSSSSEDNHRISLRQISTDVTENYDSDLDIDALPEEEVTFEAKNLVAKLRSLKHSQQDGSGYLYVFGSDDDDCMQFKVGASRFPSARLEQAQLFNPSLEMVLSVSVSRRREGLRRAGTALESHLAQGTVHWYNAPKQNITDAVMQVADSLPAEDTSTC